MELKKYFSKFLTQRKKNFSEKDYYLSSEISKITGCGIQNINLYREAFSLKTTSKNKEIRNYERLEFLGDSVLGAIISCHLFATYPDANEGYLTQMKSKIVNRKNLNKLGSELNLPKFLQNESQTPLSENIAGNLFEALIGALYLDVDYETCKKVVLERLLTPSEINKLENKIVSYKGLLLEWSQKKKVNIKYETCEELQPNKSLVFRSYVWLDEEKISNATETSKKKAEEKAAQRAFYILNKKQSILENQKLLLDIEDDDEEITLGLVRLAKEVPDYELFYKINSINSFQFSRIEDFVYHGFYYDYYFPRFQTYHTESKICIHFISNKSTHFLQKKISTELFSGEQETKYLLDHFQDVDYLIKTSETFDDFSLILLPENLVFKTQEFTLSSDEELYQLIQYYE